MHKSLSIAQYIAVVFFLISGHSLLSAQEIQWIANYDTAKQRAFAGKFFIILYFENGMIGQSFKMDREIWNRPSIIALAKNYICFKVDYTRLSQSRNMIARDRVDRLGLKYRIKNTPAVIISDAVGNELQRSVGYMSENDLGEMLKKFPLNLADLYPVLERLVGDPDNVRLKIQAGDIYRNLKMPLVSNRYYAEVENSDTVKVDRELADHIATSRAVNLDAL